MNKIQEFENKLRGLTAYEFRKVLKYLYKMNKIRQIHVSKAYIIFKKESKG